MAYGIALGRKATRFCSTFGSAGSSQRSSPIIKSASQLALSSSRALRLLSLFSHAAENAVLTALSFRSASLLVASLRLRYHRLHPEYIHSRIEKMRGKFSLRILLVMCDVVSGA